MPQPFKKAKGFRKVRAAAKAPVAQDPVPQVQAVPAAAPVDPGPAVAEADLPEVIPAEGRPVPAAVVNPAAPGPVAAASNKSKIAGGWTGDKMTLTSCLYYKVYMRPHF